MALQAKHVARLEALLLDDSFDGEVYPRELLARHTSYRIGGPARYYVRCDALGALTSLVDVCVSENIQHLVIGRGTNLLVSDDGYDGVVIVLGRDFKGIRLDKDDSDGNGGSHILSAGAAALFSQVVQEALRNSLTGLEFGVGTPGSIGGALRMNAGSRDEWIGKCVRSVTLLDGGRRLEKLMASSIEWGYRQTSFKPDDVILECELVLGPSDPFFIRGKMEANLARRKRTQPLDMPSCGSVFKNPEGHSAAKLIDEAGLKGRSCGGAQVSEKHANFIVNRGGATASDVVCLIEDVQRRVEALYGIRLETEVKFIGF